jgi:hypothetical protein
LIPPHRKRISTFNPTSNKVSRSVPTYKLTKKFENNEVCHNNTLAESQVSRGGGGEGIHPSLGF